LNLQFSDIEFAKDFLNDVSYFRLIKAYSLGLKSENGDYNQGVTFEQIVELYLFNANFCQQLFPFIERIEINLRTRIANYFAVKYGAFGYLEKKNFPNEDYHKTFKENINQEIKRNKRSPFIKNFSDNYDGNIPFYAFSEIISFGMLSKFYKNLAVVDKKEIAKSYRINFKFLESWMECIAYVRNLCAHYGRLYNKKLTKKPKLYEEYHKQGIRNDRIFGILCCIKELVSNDNHWNEFIEQVDSFLCKYPHADKFTMGFPDDWKDILRS
jgi:abortive infection bacteriophage resistance protein